MKVLASGCTLLRGVFRTGACALLLGFAIGAQAQTVQGGSIIAAPGATATGQHEQPPHRDSMKSSPAARCAFAQRATTNRTRS